jgi:predicted nucleic acid-binding protein
VSVVVDANVIAAQSIDFPWSGAARSRFRAWLASGTVVVAPALWQYEVTTTLRKHSSRGGFTAEQLAAILDRFYSLGVRSVAPTPELQQGALEWATRLGVLATYDAAYLALADELAAPFWTADRRLLNGARALGADWVHDVTVPESESVG